MADVLKRIRRAKRPSFQALSVPEARAAYLAAAEILDPPRAPLARVVDLQVGTRDGALLPARLYADAFGRLPALLYLHGGGFTIGGLETHDSLCRQLARRSGAAVVALDYRLAPEHRFPTAVNDTWDALTWLAQHGTDLQLDTTRLAVGGDSAGGTLAAVAAILARDAGLALRLQLLVTPGTTAHADTESHRRYADGYLLDAGTIEWFFGQYIDRAQRSDWRFAPLLADDLDGVAPACVILAESDPLVDEGIAYADRLRAAGVPVQLDLVRGVVHDFIKMGRALPEALAAQQFAAHALTEAFRP
jgi:acetyl esterase